MSRQTPVRQGNADMFFLVNPETVRVQLPAMTVNGLAEPLHIHLDFDAKAVDEILLRLTVLRLKMQPPPQRN